MNLECRFLISHFEIFSYSGSSTIRLYLIKKKYMGLSSLSGFRVWGGFFVSELTVFNNTVWNLLAMKRACTDPPPVKSSNDTLLFSWSWNSSSILGERDCVGPSMPRTEAVLCSAFCRTHLPLPENESFSPLVWRHHIQCLAGLIALQPSWNNTPPTDVWMFPFSGMKWQLQNRVLVIWIASCASSCERSLK